MNTSTTIIYGPKAVNKARSMRMMAQHYGIDASCIYGCAPEIADLQRHGPALVMLDSKIAADKICRHLVENGFPAQVVKFDDAIKACTRDVAATDAVEKLAGFLDEHGTAIQVRMGRFILLHGDVKFATAWLRECGLKNADIVAPHLAGLARATGEGHQKTIAMHRTDLIGQLFNLSRAAYQG